MHWVVLILIGFFILAIFGCISDSIYRKKDKKIDEILLWVKRIWADKDTEEINKINAISTSKKKDKKGEWKKSDS